MRSPQHWDEKILRIPNGKENDDQEGKEEDSNDESKKEQVKDDMNDVLNDELEDELVGVLEEGERGKLDGNWGNEMGMNWEPAEVCKLDGVLIEVLVLEMGRVSEAFSEEMVWDPEGSKQCGQHPKLLVERLSNEVPVDPNRLKHEDWEKLG